MKIVRNGCYGGFGLSIKALVEILKRKGKKDIKVCESWGTPRDITDKPELWDVCSVVFVGDERYTTFSFMEDDKRTDPELISVVEEFGDDADGDCADLEVVEIPDGVNWEISDYDGLETIEEVHRSW